jgi:hypothetical protein
MKMTLHEQVGPHLAGIEEAAIRYSFLQQSAGTIAPISSSFPVVLSGI